MEVQNRVQFVQVFTVLVARAVWKTSLYDEMVMNQKVYEMIKDMHTQWLDKD